MKQIISALLLLISITASSQSIRKHIFENYFINYPETLRNNPIWMENTFTIDDIDDGFYYLVIKTSETSSIKADLKYKESFDFAGQTTYEYEGEGYINTHRMYFAIESTVKLSDLTKGVGYTPKNNEDIKDFEVHLFYWRYGTKEPLMKRSFYFYPIKNKK